MNRDHNTNPARTNPDITDPSLHDLSRRLDALGADDARAPDGLEERVLLRVGEVMAPAPTPIAASNRSWWSGGVRIAAGIALLGSISAVIYTAARPAAPVPQAEVVSVALVEERIDALLALGGDDTGAFGESIASIELWVDTIGSEVGNGWLDADLGNLGLSSDEGSL